MGFAMRDYSISYTADDQMADALEGAVRDGLPSTWLAARGCIGLRSVVRAVASHYDITPAELIANRSRMREHVYQRRVAMVLARQLTRASYPRIARLWGMDHTTVLQNVKAYESNPKNSLRHEVQAIKIALTTNPNPATQTKIQMERR